MPEVKSAAKSLISELLSRSKFPMSVVEQLPRRIHTRFGGKPRITLRSAKSAFFVTTTKSFSLACSHTEVSVAEPRQQIQMVGIWINVG